MNNVIQAENDGMPVQVSTDLLAGKQRATNRLRKTCWSAREKIFVSTNRRKPSGVRLQNKLAKANCVQLVKWQRRWKRKGDRLQDKLFEAEQRNDVAMCEGLKAIIGTVDLFSTSVHNEIVSRVKNSGAKP